jgi:hypothetical protein
MDIYTPVQVLNNELQRKVVLHMQVVIEENQSEN